MCVRAEINPCGGRRVTKQLPIILAFFNSRQQKTQFKYGEQTGKSLTNWITDSLPQQEVLFRECLSSSSNISTQSDIFVLMLEFTLNNDSHSFSFSQFNYVVITQWFRNL